MSDNDYGPKTGAAEDHPYNDPAKQNRLPVRPSEKDGATPPDGHTEIDSEADLDEPADR